MTAPSSAYQLYSKKHKLSGVLQKSFTFAKNISPYLSKADKKAFFRLDFIYKEGDVAFVGGVFPGGTNAQYHTASRMGIVFAGYRLLDDAGLNTMGDCDLSAVISAVENNGFKISGTFYSAFYCATTAYGIKWKKHSDTSYITKQIGASINENTTLQVTAQTVDVDVSDQYYIEAPYDYDLKAYITNSEGTYERYFGVVKAIPIVKTLKLGATLNQAFNNITVNVYASRRTMAVGSNLFDDELGVSASDIGIYMETSPTLPGQQVKYYVTQLVNRPSGEAGDPFCQVTSTGWYTIPYPRTAEWYSGYALFQDMWDIMIEMASIDGSAHYWSNYYLLYYDSQDGKYYISSDGNSVAADGCYVRNYGNDVLIIYNGTKIN